MTKRRKEPKPRKRAPVPLIGQLEKLRSILERDLPADEKEALRAFLDRLQRQQLQNRANQKAWRERQRK